MYSGSSQAINSFLTFYGWSIGWAPTLRFSQGFTRISPIVKDHSSAGFGKRKVWKIIVVESLWKKLGFTLRTWYKCANFLTAVHRLIWNLNRKNYLEFNCRKGGWVKLLVWGGDNLSEAGLARDMKGLVTWDTLPHFHTAGTHWRPGTQFQPLLISLENWQQIVKMAKLQHKISLVSIILFF